jgi:hypothetical protein
VGIQLKFDSVYASWDNLKPSVPSAASRGEYYLSGDKGIIVTVCRRRESGARIGRDPDCSSHPWPLNAHDLNLCAAKGVLSRGEKGLLATVMEGRAASGSISARNRRDVALPSE